MSKIVDINDMQTLSLSVRGKISAFDISHDDQLICISSPGCLTVFSSNDTIPKRVIHYEQPKQVRKLRFQSFGNIAVLRCGVVSLWNPQNSLRPLMDIIQVPNAVLNDFEFSVHRSYELATGFSSTLNSSMGVGAFIWDLRQSKKPVNTLLTHGFSCSQIEYSKSNEYIIAAAIDNKKVVLFDTRYSPHLSHDPCLTIDSTVGVSTFCFGGKEGKGEKEQESLFLATESKSIHTWHVNFDNTTTPYKMNAQFTQSLNNILDNRNLNILLPGYYSSSILVYTQIPITSLKDRNTATALNDIIPLEILLQPDTVLDRFKYIQIIRHFMLNLHSQNDTKQPYEINRDALIYSNLSNESIVSIKWSRKNSNVSISLLMFCF